MKRLAAKMRKLRLLPLLVWAVVAGCAVRYLRRLRGAAPRIWHSFNPIHMTSYTVQADHAAGFPSRSVVLSLRAPKYELWRSNDFDVVVQQLGVPWDEAHWRGLMDLLRHGDIWSAYFDCLFFGTSQTRANIWTFRLV